MLYLPVPGPAVQQRALVSFPRKVNGELVGDCGTETRQRHSEKWTVQTQRMLTQATRNATVRQRHNTAPKIW